jgi:DUF4097 and DUF4098 domain-containing protein YvlB
MRFFIRASLVISALLLVGTSALGQDYSRTFQMETDASININNISGDIVVTGYDGNAVIVNGRKTGRDQEMLQIEDRSTGNRVDVRVKYPDHCNCDASVNFEVKVPRAIRYTFDSISTVSGQVAVTDVTGDLKARSVSGEVRVKTVRGATNASAVSGRVLVDDAVGSVSAKSTSGAVDVVITQLQGTEEMDFSSVSGGVEVKMPGNLDANVEMSVLSGGLKTDFPLHIEATGRGPGQRATGMVGAGTRSLKIKSVSGSVSLLKL